MKGKKSSNPKKVVLDTNVILFDAKSIFKFPNSDIYIPISVIEEIDRFKRDTGENGRNARHFSRLIDELRERGTIAEGVALENKTNSFLHVVVDRGSLNVPQDLDADKADNRILATALGLQTTSQKADVSLITKDINLRIKADVYGINATDYEPDDVVYEEMYSGLKELELDSTQLNEFYEKKFLKLSDDLRLLPNQYLLMKDGGNSSHSAIGRYSQSHQGAVPLIRTPDNIWGINPRNVEQSFAIDCLMNDDISFVSLVGKAGTGKTLMALAVGLAKTLDEGKFHRLLVSRPIFPMGKDIGYLPGDVAQKLNPWMQPIFDNVEFLMGSSTSQKKAAGRAQELMNQGMLNIEPLTYIRGRSIPHQYLIVDEAQNLTPHEIKTIVTRAGEGTKVVLTGDNSQIDNPYVDSASSGLTYCVERFKHYGIAAHVTLQKGERSPLAELASNIL